VIVGGSGGASPDLGPFRVIDADVLVFFWVVGFAAAGRPAMASRVKEDEKNERVIRGLLKLPANKRCINCNNLVSFFHAGLVHSFLLLNVVGESRAV
jgi:hypothetical protein